MVKTKYKIPILFLIFNRPKLTRKVLNEIRKIQPEKLFIAADGPRNNNPDDILKCAETRNIINEIDWPCEIKTKFNKRNLGGPISIPDAIKWFFETVEYGIILEDDCLPNPTFFDYCEELLYKYKPDSRIMSIAGTNILQKRWGESDYHFSYIPRSGAWATWKRAWDLFKKDIKIYNEFTKKRRINDVLDNKHAIRYWEYIFKKTYHARFHWDYNWTFTCWVNNGLTCVPNRNLISNLGFGKDGTNTKNSNSPYSNLPTRSMPSKIIHPLIILPNKEADNFFLNKFFRVKSIKVNLIRIFNEGYFFSKFEFIRIICKFILKIIDKITPLYHKLPNLFR